MDRVKTTLRALGILSAAALAACGGGGGGGGSGGSTDNSVGGVKLSGAAAKGIIKNGVVTAEELDSSGKAIRTVGTAKTDATGNYSISVGSGYMGGPVRVTVSVASDTLMKCDAVVNCGNFAAADANDLNSNNVIDRGEWFKPAADFTMKALVPKAGANDALAVSITPFSNMAAERALAQGSLSAANIANANSAVSVLLGGVDVLTTKPVDVTDPASTSGATPTQLAYAVFAAAVMSDKPGTAIASLAEEFKSAGSISAASLQAIVDAAAAQSTEVPSGNIAALTIALESLNTEIASAGGGSITPTPADTASADAITKTKAFISDLRTWGTTIELQAAAKNAAFGTQVAIARDLGAMFNDYVTSPSLEAMAKAVVMVNGETSLPKYGISVWSPCGLGYFTAGTIALSGTTVTITGGQLEGTCSGAIAIDATATVPTNLASNKFGFNITSAKFSHPAADFTLSGAVSVSVATDYTLNISNMLAGTADPIPQFTGATFNLLAKLVQKQELSPTGFVAATDPVTFNGSVNTSLVPKYNPDTRRMYAILPSTLTVTGTASNTTGGTLTGTVAFNLTNADKYQPYDVLPGTSVKLGTASMSTDGAGVETYTVALNDGTQVSIGWDPNDPDYPGSVRVSYTPATGGGFAATYGQADSLLSAVSMYGWFLYDAIWSGVDVPGQGTYRISGYDPVMYDADWVPTGLTVGDIYGVMSSAELSDRADNYADFDLALSVQEQLPGLPLATVQIAADRTAYDAGAGSLTIKYGTRQLALSSTSINATTASGGTVTITNQDGVQLVIAPSYTGNMLDGAQVKLNGNTYANATKWNGMVKLTYTDGTFEIF